MLNRSVFGTLVVVILLVGLGYGFRYQHEKQAQEEVRKTELDKIVVALRESRNRLQVYHIGGDATTVRTVPGGPLDMLMGTIKVRQPFTNDYYVDMADVSLDSYIWDDRTRTLIVRTPLPRPDAPNIDASRQIVATQGMWITRSMQDQMRAQAAIGAKQQVEAEARKPENLASASKAARAAIIDNVHKPLEAIGMGDIKVVATDPSAVERDDERWDVSRSIAEVLAKR